MNTWTFLLKLFMSALCACGFSILFYFKPRRLPLAALNGVITCGVYLGVQALLGGEFIPNMAGAFAGGIFAEIMARVTKVPVPVYLIPSMIILVPGSLLYRTMNYFISGAYGMAGECALTTLAVAAGIAGGVMTSSILGMMYIRIRETLMSKRRK
ncbi:MAG: threonine/serine exporter family protein [Clostridia bacterium]|nr:threonine/serine exporter family protein [Clostridia bacterium]